MNPICQNVKTGKKEDTKSFKKTKLFVYLCQKIKKTYMPFFETIFLEEADMFVASLDVKTRQKIFYNIRVAEQTNDPELFKKLNDDIWEFRTLFNKKMIRILAFWDKTNKTQTLVFATNGFVKKTQKTPINEIERAKRIREKYFIEKGTR